MKHRDDMDDIYREHGKTVYRFLQRMCGDAELAQDLTQDTFLRAMESADRFDDSCKMTTWLCQIAKNLCYDHLRYQQRHQTEALMEESAQAPAHFLEELLENADLALQIRSIVHELAEPYWLQSHKPLSGRHP
ncbi:MAG: sigma-70 family RNA polymerase sigma factor [Oscillospiraceae bacterium]|nr:sigma-70 family RNA polymerase sigma factor [Oscillospiraceae bacterium]